jgi:hypothetical protein
VWAGSAVVVVVAVVTAEAATEAAVMIVVERMRKVDALFVVRLDFLSSLFR